MHLVESSAAEAELRGRGEALLCVLKYFPTSWLWVEGDSLRLIQALKSGSGATGFSTLFVDVKQLFTKFQTLKLIQSLHEGNQCQKAETNQISLTQELLISIKVSELLFTSVLSISTPNCSQ